VAWRILDARYFGVPQRRRRVFIVARRADSQHDPRSASRLALRALFESGSGDTSSGWQAWTETTRSIGDGADDGGSVGTHGRVDEGPTGTLTRMYSEQSGQDFAGGRSDCIYNSTAAFGAWREDREAGALSQRDYKSTNHILIGNGGGQRECAAFRKSRRAADVTDDETWVDADHANTLNAFDVGDTRTTHAIVANGSAIPSGEKDEIIAFYPTGGSQNGFWDTSGVSPTIKVGSGVEASNGIAIVNALDRQAGGPDDNSAQAGHLVSHTLTSAGHDASEDGTGRGTPIVPDQMTVRRLTPVECERLMGWPDGWTAPEGVKASDSKRYAACGDGIVAPVAFWIADRIRMIEEEEAS
jgi:DNA (cytosine-5)-methyltransferase 1